MPGGSGGGPDSAPCSGRVAARAALFAARRTCGDADTALRARLDITGSAGPLWAGIRGTLVPRSCFSGGVRRRVSRLRAARGVRVCFFARRVTRGSCNAFRRLRASFQPARARAGQLLESRHDNCEAASD